MAPLWTFYHRLSHLSFVSRLDFLIGALQLIASWAMIEGIFQYEFLHCFLSQTIENMLYN